MAHLVGRYVLGVVLSTSKSQCENKAVEEVYVTYRVLWQSSTCSLQNSFEQYQNAVVSFLVGLIESTEYYR